jgi:hypothetical protein
MLDLVVEHIADVEFVAAFGALNGGVGVGHCTGLDEDDGLLGDETIAVLLDGNVDVSKNNISAGCKSVLGRDQLFGRKRPLTGQGFAGMLIKQTQRKKMKRFQNGFTFASFSIIAMVLITRRSGCSKPGWGPERGFPGSGLLARIR